MMEQRPIEQVVSDIFNAMPAELSMQDKLASLVSVAVFVADLPAEHAWHALVAVVSQAHGGAVARVQVSQKIEDDEEHEERLTCNSTGTTNREVLSVDRGPAKPH